MYLKRNKSHRWYWISKQRPDEVTSFVVWDSLRPAEARGTWRINAVYVMLSRIQSVHPIHRCYLHHNGEVPNQGRVLR